MSEKGFIPPYTGYLKKTPKSIMLKRMEEENWKLKCVEAGLGEKESNVRFFKNQFDKLKEKLRE